MDNGFAFTEKNAMCTEARFSCTTTKGTCKASGYNVSIAQGSVTGDTDVSTDNEQAHMPTMTKQPVSVGTEADQSLFQSYSFWCVDRLLQHAARPQCPCL